jgi:hypothetical protein
VKTADLAWAWAAGHVTAVAVTAVAVLAAAVLTRRLLRGRHVEDMLTLLAAVMAQAVVMNGMWRFAGNVLHFSGVERASLFAFLEICVVACALRARRNMRRFNAAGVEGTAVWVLSALSGVFSALDARSFVEALFRLSTPLVAAWMWHRAISLERRERTGQATHWRLTAERILVWLHLAEPQARTASEVDAHRRISRLARAAKRLRVLRAAGAKPWRLSLVLRRLDTALEGAVEHAGLAVDPVRQDQLLAQIGALTAAESLATLPACAPWERSAPEPVPPVPAIQLFDEMARTITPVIPQPVPLPEGPLPEGLPGPAPDDAYLAAWSADEQAVPEPEPYLALLDLVPALHHEEDRRDEDGDDIVAEAAGLFGPEPEPAPAAPVPQRTAAPAAKRTAALKPPAAKRTAAQPDRYAGLPVPKREKWTAQRPWTPERAGLTEEQIRAAVAALSRNALADWLGVGSSAASRIKDTYGQPQLAGAR